MPKMKSNRMARKKFRVNGKGGLKHARANTSHNTGKRPKKRMRQLRGRANLNASWERHLSGQLPYRVTSN